MAKAYPAGSPYTGWVLAMAVLEYLTRRWSALVASTFPTMLSAKTASTPTACTASSRVEPPPGPTRSAAGAAHHFE
eukprot:scaffold16861_cov101-Isochrysis_galbana.AAC.4